MNETPQLERVTAGERMIRTPGELSMALAEAFLANADDGNHAANDELVGQLCAWKRGRQA